MRRAPPIILTPLERAQLEDWASREGCAERRAVRARIVLKAAEGSANREIATRLGIHPETVGRWRRRFALHRLEGVRRDAPRSGRRSTVPAALMERIVRLTAAEPALRGGGWTTRSLARALKVNHMAVHRIWQAYGRAGAVHPPWLSPSARRRTIRIDLLGLYVGAPASAIVFRTAGTTSELRSEDPVHAHWTSGAHVRAPRPHLPPSLAGFLTGVEAARSRPGPVTACVGSSHDLLVFFRGLEEESAPPTSELHIIFDRPQELLPPRVVEWLRSRVRVRTSWTTRGFPWTAAVDEWVRTFSGTLEDPESFRDVGSLLESLAESGVDVRRGFCWSHGEGAGGVPFASAPARTNIAVNARAM